MTNETTNTLSIRLPKAAAKRAAELARKHDISKSFLLRLGLSVLDAADRAPKGSYLGLTRDREGLEIALVLPFMEPIIEADPDGPDDGGDLFSAIPSDE